MAAVLSFGLVAAACGDSKAGDEDSQDDRDTSDITVAGGDGEAKDGGRVVYALEADSDGYNPTANRWAISGNMVGAAVYDPLSAFDENYEVQPYLAEEFIHNKDFTEWTIKLREGITFHNGEELTSEDVASILEAHTKSLLTSSTVDFIAKDPGPDGEEGTADDEADITTPDPLTVVVKMKGPWATFPSILAGQAGVVPHPSVYDGSNPNGAREPIGTGPFEQKEWTPDTRWVGTKYDDYWQEGLPHLDEIEFRPVLDVETRVGALQNGDIQLFHTTDPEVILEMRESAEAGEVQLVEDTGEGEETFILLNTAAEPFDNANARRALALATDKDLYVETIAPGTEPANGPFAPDSRWYDPVVEEAYPQYDLEAAREAVADYEEETGKPLQLQLSNTTASTSREQSNLLTQMWEEAGIEVTTREVEQSVHISNAVSGAFQANAWRQFGEPDPDNGYHWWMGTSNLNFSNNADDAVDEALLAARATDDVDARKEQYAIVQERFAEDLPYIWIHHTRWAIVASNDVRGITNGPLPSGEPSLPLGSGFSGTHRVVYLWLDD